jgi:aminoglycoside phosphotransferase (APT) family kinase protein
MDYVEGETLSEYNKIIPQTLADLTIKLHKIDPEPLRKQFKSSGLKEEYFTALWTYEKYLHSNKIEWLNQSLKWLKENKPKSDDAVIHDDLHHLNVMISDGAVSGVLDWSGLIDDRLRDVGSTLVLYNLMAPSVWSYRRSEFRRMAKLFLDQYSSKFSVDPWKLEYYEAVRCFRVMVDYEIGFELVHSSGMHKATCERFKEITEISDLNEPW